MSERYSAEVSLWLEIANDRIPLAQVGPDDVVLASPSEVLPGVGVVCVSVDGQVSRYPVEFPDGALPFDSIMRVHATGEQPTIETIS
ncbi:hypothetical protein [Calycomorphotria hydatis]|uniref:hypothetical protein n=1 Tax=Calycomorphotria hydatis TaxID=2528027 RepID=UPI0011A39B14|nr:hypothetical protein [Calycomorphotria hydatis]